MLYEKVALVTAGSAGLGACIATMLARDGMRVVIDYSNNTTRAMLSSQSSNHPLLGTEQVPMTTSPPSKQTWATGTQSND
jgi:NAD(P)-dependent dehydrogenase (short-subunit alcohol dehydrogenase family)